MIPHGEKSGLRGPLFKRSARCSRLQHGHHLQGITMELQYQLKGGSYCLVDMTQPPSPVTGERPVRLKTDNVAIAFEASTGMLREHGSPARIQLWFSRMRRTLHAQGDAHLANDLVMISGPLPVDEINKCLWISGYCRRLWKRLGTLPNGKAHTSRSSATGASGAAYSAASSTSGAAASTAASNAYGPSAGAASGFGAAASATPRPQAGAWASAASRAAGASPTSAGASPTSAGASPSSAGAAAWGGTAASMGGAGASTASARASGAAASGGASRSSGFASSGFGASTFGSASFGASGFGGLPPRAPAKPKPAEPAKANPFGSFGAAFGARTATV